MTAGDLVGRVAFDALGAGVPIGHDAVGIDHVDGVIGDAVDERAEPTLALAQRILRLLPFRPVPRQRGEARDLAIGVADRVQQRERPEAAAALAHAPAFLFIASAACGDRKAALRQILLPLLRREEAREMLANDLFFRIAIDALGARIPARDKAVGIEHVDRGVHDRIDQGLIAALRRSVAGGPDALRHDVPLRLVKTR
jgi:hypothetical protein